MQKPKLKLSPQPQLHVRYIRPYDLLPRTSFAKKSSLQWKLASMALFAAGGLTGAGFVIQDRLSLADNKAPDGQVAGAATTIPIQYDPSEIEVVAELLPELIEETRHEPSAEELHNQRRLENLRAYFKKWKSPFANDDATLSAFLESKNMRLMIAIAFVESSMGKKCYYKNCSGIGGYPPNLRKYDSHAAWIRDFDNLLERRYKGLPIEKFMGLYVQPGSPNWINGVKQILGELEKANIE